MRVRETSDRLTFNVVAGAYVVLFGIDLPEEDCGGLLGFSLHRQDHADGSSRFLSGTKRFEATAADVAGGPPATFERHPLQSFQWTDYTVEAGRTYTYTLRALRGTPERLEAFAEVEVEVRTESPEDGLHDVYFNRGVAASQAYQRRFGDVAPQDVPGRAAFDWLSRGLNEALESFLDSCQPGRHALRIAAYEFNYDRFLAKVKQTVDRGVDVRVVYDARKDYPRDENDAAVAAAGLDGVSYRRTRPSSYISHNKFIVRLEDGAPASVWTGGTNFSEGGIYGHSNVAHVVEEPETAERFLAYWDALAADPDSRELKRRVGEISPLPGADLPEGTSVLFSPFHDAAPLDLYAALAGSAEQGLFMTFAFGMNDAFKEIYKNSAAPFRLALMEQAVRPMRPGPARDAEEKSIRDLRRMPQNTFAVGSLIRTNEFDGWVRERLSRLNGHVRYVHNKFMLVDPLSDDPVVVAGSANFSDASVRRNDENMLLIRGDRRVADIYLGEFMRLYSHHAFRESLGWRDPDDRQPRWLRTDDWWRDYFGDTPRSARRRFFALSAD